MTSERAGGCVQAAGGRNNEHSTLKQNPLLRSLGDFIEAYSPDDRSVRMESERFRRFSYQELVARDKASLDIFWLRAQYLEDTDNLPPTRSCRLVLSSPMSRFRSTASAKAVKLKKMAADVSPRWRG